MDRDNVLLGSTGDGSFEDFGVVMKQVCAKALGKTLVELRMRSDILI